MALALGLVALSFLEWLRVDLMAYLFGDVLAVTTADLLWIWGGGAVALAALLWLWSALLSITLNEELAQAEGVDVGRVRFGFVLVMALAVAIGMKIVGILLIVSLLVIPAAAARHLSRTPEQMAALAALIGALAVMHGRRRLAGLGHAGRPQHRARLGDPVRAGDGARPRPAPGPAGGLAALENAGQQAEPAA